MSCCSVHVPQENDEKANYLRIDGNMCWTSFPIPGVDPECDLHLSAKGDRIYLVDDFCARYDYCITCKKHPTETCLAKDSLLSNKKRNELLLSYATTIPYFPYDQTLSIPKQLKAHPSWEDGMCLDFLSKLQLEIFALSHYNKPIANVMLKACVDLALKDFQDLTDLPYLGPPEEKLQWEEDTLRDSCADFLALKMKEQNLLYWKQIQFSSHVLFCIEQSLKQNKCLVEDCECM